MTSISSPDAADLTDRLSGIALFATIILVVIAEWGGGRLFYQGAALAVIVFVALQTPRVGWSRRIFVATGLLLLAAAVVTRPDWLAMVDRALETAAFVAAFFLALAWLRNAAATSLTIERCGTFLASQPPGRRYLALTVGGHLYGLILSYGTISLLGSLAESGARSEPDPEIRAIRMRRMLLAIHRGFVTTTCWSPLTYSIAISTALVPGASWSGAVGFCLVSAGILASLGWALDTVFKPRISGPPPARKPPQGSWSDVTPLLGLLLLLMGSVGAIQLATGARTVAVVMIVVPVVSLAWIALQGRDTRDGGLGHMLRRGLGYVVVDAPDYRSELVLLIMAGFIGTIGAALAGPVMQASGIHLELIPTPVLLVGLMWLVPVTGQLGMNPILSVSLITPLVPNADVLGVSPNAVIVAITAGWALAGITSPYTATTLLVGALGRVPALHVGLGLNWNGPYALIGGILLSVWVVIASTLV